MVESLRHLLGESIDFSGLTGPDELTVNEALERYLRYQSGVESWILSRFVCPQKKLQELSRCLEKHSVEASFPVAVLAKATSSNAEWEDELAASAHAMNEFDGATHDLVEVAGFEIRPPKSRTPQDVLRDLRGFSEVDVLIETSLTAENEGLLAAIAESDWAFLKADLSLPTRPDSFLVAKLLHEALALELPFKVVQGKGRSITNEKEFGTINLFAAVAIGMSEDLSKREIEAVLIENEWTHWHFGLDSVSFRGWEADSEAIDQARELILDAQCTSVEYAIDDLATLGFAVREGL